MRYKARVISLKNGQKAIIKSPEEINAKEMLDYLKAVSRESHFLLRYEEEVTMSEEDEEKKLKEYIDSKTGIMISIFVEDKVVGSISINVVSDKMKTKHRSALGIAIRKEYTGLGLGKLLIQEAIKTAKETGYEQIELEVIEGNKKAINLYKSQGFEDYGLRKKAIKLKDDSYLDEILMMKKLR